MQQEADTLVEWDASIVRRFLNYAPPVTPSATLMAAATGDLEVALDPVVAALAPDDFVTLKAVFADDGAIPQELDRALLRIGRIHHGQNNLTDAERVALRTTFRRPVLAR